MGTDVEMYCDAAGAYFMRREYSKAIANYKKALEIAPDGV